MLLFFYLILSVNSNQNTPPRPDSCSCCLELPSSQVFMILFKDRFFRKRENSPLKSTTAVAISQCRKTICPAPSRNHKKQGAQRVNYRGRQIAGPLIGSLCTLYGRMIEICTCVPHYIQNKRTHVLHERQRDSVCVKTQSRQLSPFPFIQLFTNIVTSYLLYSY